MWRIPTDTPQTSTPNGRTKLQEVTPETPLDEIFQKWGEDGALVIKGLLTPGQVAEFTSEIEQVIEKTRRGALLDHPLLQAFHGRRTKRAAGLANHSKVFRENLLENDLVHAICHRNYTTGGNAGDYWLSTGSTLFAGGPQDPQELHRDLNNYPPAVLLGPDFDDVQMNFLIALSPFREDNGATRVIPGSQKWPFDQRGNQEMTIPAIMDPGDCLLLSGKVVHGMGANTTTEERKALQLSVCAGYLTPSEAHPSIVTLETAKKLSPRAQRFLGFRSQYPRGSPGLWTKDYTELALHLELDDLDGLMVYLRDLAKSHPVEDPVGKLF
ncbi:hypothetical protein H634G_09370 [Metarhizium anisopliae BRIP 53293]|uniref:Dioxygenase n=1 Tax=Metarhizium anisopliae BRIP 53293 TaxID=1291518 RepID=A0A0D9NMP1_METAN|nr:hypothetical protein H634G_09370 [Metarhizium anisopliae BRIP 53293]KJK91767.1 hypothetical protein H633G_04383 [Metarhizium anisopliae BRIP 53284]